MKVYKKELLNAKRESWRNFCESVESSGKASRLRKILSKNSSSPTFLQRDDGSWTESSEEMNNILLSTHFPGCRFSELNLDYFDFSPVNDDIGDIIDTEKIKWSISSFESFKSPGFDGIIPMMLKKTSNLIVPYLNNIYKGCLTFRYIPLEWRRVKVVFIPKSGNINHSSAKDYRPISLSSFLLKVL